MTRAERLLELTRHMVRLEGEIALLRAEFARLCGDPVSNAVLYASGRRMRQPAPLIVLAQACLDERAPVALRIHEIAAAIGATKESTAAALSKLVYAGRARRPGTGLYSSMLDVPPPPLKPPESTE